MTYYSGLAKSKYFTDKFDLYGLMRKAALMMSFVVLMALSANSFVYLPFTPVPLTLQVLTVLASGILLGSKIAFFTQASYILLGIAGMPIFSGFKSGIAALLGPTGGYIIGFLLAAFACGFIYERINSRYISKNISCFVSCIAGLSLIYLFGFSHLYLMFPASSFSSIFNIAVKPFFIVDLIKIFVILNINSMVLKNEKN